MPTGIMCGRVPFGCRAPPSVVFSCQSFCSSQKLAAFQCCAAFSYALEKFYARHYLKCCIANLENRPVAPTARQVGTLPHWETGTMMHAKSGVKLGIGVIGCGNISMTYLRNAALFSGVELRACADISADTAA